MNATEVIGYSFDAAYHCEDCTREQFPQADDEFSDVQDSEGNDIHPIFAGDEHHDDGEYCSDCGCELWEPADRSTDEDSD